MNRDEGHVANGVLRSQLSRAITILHQSYQRLHIIFNSFTDCSCSSHVRPLVSEAMRAARTASSLQRCSPSGRVADQKS